MGEFFIGNIKGPKGEAGQGFKIVGYYPTVEALFSDIANPIVGDAYGVGSNPPYDIYIYSENSGWVNNGAIQGAKGDDGKDGTNATISSVSATVDNTNGTPNVTVSMGGTDRDRTFSFAFSGLKGEQGPQGEKGADGSNGININAEGGLSAGTNATATTGGAVGKTATTARGGAAGDNARAFGDGGAIGDNAREEGGGLAGGKSSYAIDGGVAVGYDSDSTEGGGSVGYMTRSNGGGSVGYKAVNSKGFSGGYMAQVSPTADHSEYIDAIQLGTGTNPTPHSLQVYDKVLMNQDGTIPVGRFPNTISKIETVTYTGNGTCGWTTNDITEAEKAKLTKITFSAPPKVVCVAPIGLSDGTGVGTLIALNGQRIQRQYSVGSDYAHTVETMWEGNSVFIGSDGAVHQYNATDASYIAIGLL